ncbi:MAG: hypothetical protein ACYSUN_14410 [Planctomycetota bacterium]
MLAELLDESTALLSETPAPLPEVPLPEVIDPPDPPTAEPEICTG